MSAARLADERLPVNRDPAFSSATTLLRALRARRIGSLELLDHYLARIALHNPALNAIVVTRVEAARKAAKARDRASRSNVVTGALHGLPMTVKESFDVTGLPSTWGMPSLRANLAQRNAAAVDRLEGAGAVIFGKTNIPVMLADWQSYNPVYGTTVNPWDATRTPGGSSGGAAAALAAGLTSLDIGSDIGGSIRNPAHCCGVYGHKPTYGLVPTAGHAMPGSLFPVDINVTGPLARSAADLELAFKVLAGPDATQARSWSLNLKPARQKSLAEFRVAVVTDSVVAPVDGRIRGELDALAGFLSKSKVRVSRTARPALPEAEVYTLYIHLLRAATSAIQNDPASLQQAIAAAARLHADDHSYQAEQLRGNTMRHRDWIVASNRRHVLMQAWTDFFGSHDLLLCPAAPVVAFPHDHKGERATRVIEVDGKPRSVNEHLFWAGYSGVFYLPSTVAPIGRSPEGLPIGVQIIGPPGADLACIRFARLLEQAYHRFEAPPGFAT